MGKNGIPKHESGVSGNKIVGRIYANCAKCMKDVNYKPEKKPASKKSGN